MAQPNCQQGVVYGQPVPTPQAQYTNIPERPRKEWAEGCCSCPCDLCLEVFFCSYCQLARLNAVSNGMAGTPKYMNSPEWGTCCALFVAGQVPGGAAGYVAQHVLDYKLASVNYALLSSAGSLVGWFLISMFGVLIRMRTVEQLRIEEGQCQTFCQSFWCMPCSLAQMHQEWTLAGQFPGGCCCRTDADMPQVAQQAIMQPGYNNNNPRMNYSGNYAGTGAA